MQQYLDLVGRVLEEGTYKPNRTDADSIASFSQHYQVDLSEGYPLLTTKDLSGFRWNSLIHEFLWYLSGEEHIRNLQEETSIWDAWADDEGHLDTAYGRFWRRYPIPEGDAQLPGETWPDDAHRWTNDEGTFDQIGYVLDGLRENPNSRRYVVSAWHPANAAVSELPPCHYTFVVNVQGDRLNVHLTQRSGDVASASRSTSPRTPCSPRSWPSARGSNSVRSLTPSSTRTSTPERASAVSGTPTTSGNSRTDLPP